MNASFPSILKLKKIYSRVFEALNVLFQSFECFVSKLWMFCFNFQSFKRWCFSFNARRICWMFFVWFRCFDCSFWLSKALNMFAICFKLVSWLKYFLISSLKEIFFFFDQNYFHNNLKPQVPKFILFLLREMILKLLIFLTIFLVPVLAKVRLLLGEGYEDCSTGGQSKFVDYSGIEYEYLTDTDFFIKGKKLC